MSNNATAEHVASVMVGIYNNDWLLNLPITWDTLSGDAVISLADLEYALGAPNIEWAEAVAAQINGKDT